MIRLHAEQCDPRTRTLSSAQQKQQKNLGARLPARRGAALPAAETSPPPYLYAYTTYTPTYLPIYLPANQLTDTILSSSSSVLL